MRLGDLCQLRTGITLRGHRDARPNERAGAPLIQAGDVGRDALPRRFIEPGASPAEAELKLDDLLIVSRGTTFPCDVVGSDFAGGVAASPIVRARLKGDAPTSTLFLRAYLCMPATQTRLRASAPGTHVPQLTLASLADFDVPIPAKSVQDAFIELSELIAAEHTLQQRVTEKRQALLARLLAQEINGAVQ